MSQDEEHAARSRIPRLVLPYVALWIGAILIVMQLLRLSATRLLLHYWPSVVGSAIIGIAAFFLLGIPHEKLYRRERFIDLDRRPGVPHPTGAVLPNREPAGAPNDSENLPLSHTLRPSQAPNSGRHAGGDNGTTSSASSFPNYFAELVNALGYKAFVADRKASMLLDKGTRYSQFGIVFFFLAIVAWQLLAWKTGFRAHVICGIVSTSFLFIFIECLGAWFLRQYRHFTDTSTYLMKVKAIFDRYLLAYLVAKDEIVAQSEERARTIEGLVAMLQADVQWPDHLIFARGDVSFARETLGAVTDLVKHLRVDGPLKSRGN